MPEASPVEKRAGALYLADMAILPILEAPNPVLKQVSTPVTIFDAALRQLVEDMFETMYDAPGIGLAAVQVGVPKRLLVIDLQEPATGEDAEEDAVINTPRVFVNPVILDPSEERSVYNEGCLSVPEFYAEVERPARILAHWQDLDGNPHEEAMDGMMATCLQHEMDHLEGILFIDHLSRLKRNMALKKMEKNRNAA